MKRRLYEQLVRWKHSRRRKPLLLGGARQVGKTWLLKEFARREFESSLYLNFEEDPGLAQLFEPSRRPATLLRNLALYTGQPIDAERTLLILDEIQVSAAAVSSLKYFCEEARHVHVAAAGSLLGVRMSKAGSFPVGKVDFLDLRPMSFLEFLGAIGDGGLGELVWEQPTHQPIAEPLHRRLIERLRTYLYVGGMPEAVAAYREELDPGPVRAIQQAIVRAYRLDFAKYAPTTDIPKLSAVWDSIPGQLARENRKFMFSAVRKGARARGYEDALAWLSGAGLVHKAMRVSAPRAPLAAYAQPTFFKLYLLDVGLLSAMVDLPTSALVEGPRPFEQFNGALTENYVAQQLLHRPGARLYYWSADRAAAEVDFVCEHGGAVYPLEVKAGINLRSKSLRSFDDRFAPPFLGRTNLLGFKHDGRYRNCPLYAVDRFPEV